MPEGLARRGIAIALVAFVAGLFASSLSSGLFVAVTGKSAKSFGASMAGSPGFWLGLVGVPLLASRKWGSGRARTDYRLDIVWRQDLPIGIAAGLLGQFLIVAPVVRVFQLLSPHLELTEQSVDVAKQAHGGGLVLVVVLFCVGAPIVEEFFFRGVLQGALQARMRPWAAVVITAGIFGLVHLSGSGAGAVAVVTSLALFGVVLGALFVRTGRLGAGIVAHMTFNLLATIGLIFSSIHGK